MANPAWRARVRHTEDGEAVRAGVDGRPTRDLEAQTNYLKSRLDESAAGSALYDSDRALAPGLVVGSPVYWDATAQRYAAAYAAWGPDPGTGTVRALPPAGVVGILAAKSSDVLGTVLLLGRVTGIDLAPVVVGGVVTAGNLWLSGDVGKLTYGDVPTGPLVGIADGDGGVFVLPNLRNFAEDHVHYSFNLTPAPAGTHLFNPDNTHAIVDADPSLPGWLPADDPVFGGRAPAGAKFGYNLAAQPALNRTWPPVPLESVGLFVDTGETGSGVELYTLGSEIVRFDRYGIWWMTACYGDVPWPVLYGIGSLSSAVTSSSSSETAAACPVGRTMRIILLYSRMAFATDKSVVTRLRAAAGSPIRILNCDGEAAETGDLLLDLDAGFSLVGTTEAGHLVVKTQDGTRLKRGPVVEGLFAHPDGSVVLASGTTQVVDGVTLYQGRVVVQAVLEAGERLLLTQVVSLSDVRERTYQNVMFVGFPAGTASSLRAKIAVPKTGLPVGTVVKIRVRVLGRAAGTLPNLTFTYRRIPAPVGTTPQALPTADTPGTLVTAAAVGVDQYLDFESDAFAVAAGDVVQFTLARAAGDGYAGEVGILNVVGVLTGS